MDSKQIEAALVASIKDFLARLEAKEITLHSGYITKSLSLEDSSEQYDLHINYFVVKR